MQRWNVHISGMRGKSKMTFHKALRKYGCDVWDHEILEEVTTKIQANKRETWWIAHFDSMNPSKGYNRHVGGSGGQMPESSRKRTGEKLKGRPKSLEHRERMRESAKRYWANAPKTDTRREQLIQRNRSTEGRAKSVAAQKRRWKKWRETKALTSKSN